MRPPRRLIGWAAASRGNLAPTAVSPIRKSSIAYSPNTPKRPARRSTKEQCCWGSKSGRTAGHITFACWARWDLAWTRRRSKLSRSGSSRRVRRMASPCESPPRFKSASDCGNEIALCPTSQVLGSEVPRTRDLDLCRTVLLHSAENRPIVCSQTLVRPPSGGCLAGNLVCRISTLGFIPTIESDRAIQAAFPIEPDHPRSRSRRKHINEDVHEPDSPLTDLNRGILADRNCGEGDLWVDWWDKDFKDFGPASAGADAGLVVPLDWMRAEPLRLGARRAGPAPRLWSTAAWQGGSVATGRETTFPAPVARIPADMNSFPIDRE